MSRRARAFGFSKVPAIFAVLSIMVCIIAPSAYRHRDEYSSLFYWLVGYGSGVCECGHTGRNHNEHDDHSFCDDCSCLSFVQGVIDDEVAENEVIESEEMIAAREAAQEMADDLKIDERVLDIINVADEVDRVEALVVSSDVSRRIILLRSDSYVSVSVDGTDVYSSVDGTVKKYLGAGEWEHELDMVLWQLLADKEEAARLIKVARETKFKRMRESRYGALHLK